MREGGFTEVKRIPETETTGRENVESWEFSTETFVGARKEEGVRHQSPGERDQGEKKVIQS